MNQKIAGPEFRAHVADDTQLSQGPQGSSKMSAGSEKALNDHPSKEPMTGSSSTEFLSKLRAMNVVLSAQGDRLRIHAPAGVMTPALRDELTARKAEILKLLQEEPAAVRPQSQVIPRVPRDSRLPLSFAQQGLWFLAQIEGGSEAYHMPFNLRLKGTLDRSALRRALDCIVRRHEALRTTFPVIDGEPVQRIAAVEDCNFVPIEHDLRVNQNAASELDRLTNLEATTSFDLAAGPLIRGRLVQLSADEYVLLITMHHIVSDAWSLGLMVRELNALYPAFLRGEANPLPDLEIQYADYSVWQRQWIEGDIVKQQGAYWKTTLSGAPALLELPTDHPRPAVQAYSGTIERLTLDEQVTAAVREFSKRHRVTPFMTLLAAWAVLLARLSGQRDILIGLPTADRGRKEIENLVGFFVNTVVLRLNLSASPSVSQLLEQTRAQTLAALQNRDIPFEQVVELAQPVRSLAQSPLFQVMFAWNGIQEKFNLPGLEVKPLPTPHGAAQFDLTFYLQEEDNSISGGIEYATSLFERHTIERHIECFRTLLAAMVADDSQLVDRLPVLPESQRNQLLYQWNRTEMDYPREVPLAAQVEAQAAKTPDATAVIFGEESLTYRELNERANQLARELRKHGAGPDELVGIFVERSLDMMITLLAVAKSGAGYLPMDPFLPAARLQHMMEDSGLCVVVTQRPLLSELPELSGPVITLEDTRWRTNSRENLNIEVKPEHLAYVIYTSGSTGKPKGVQIPYRALLNLLWSVKDWLKFSASDRLLAVTTISFDIAGADIWLPWLVGATTILASREAAADGTQLRALIEQHDVTFLQATPVTWWLLLAATWRGKADLQIVCTGEAMPRELAAQLAPMVKRLWNLYGPTETTIWSTGYLVEDGKAPVLIGRPLGNTQCYILDGQHQLVPIGSVGELYIAGEGLARGYLKRPDLTEEKFVPNPFSPTPDARMYRTGDLARYLPDGNIECLGRTDHQVKIRGYRIELDEVQLALSQLPKIRQCVVIVREKTPGDPHLVAFYTVNEGVKPAVPEMRAGLRQSLPDYMVPNCFVELDRLPLTYNGKIDIRALPDPFTASIDAGTEISAELAPIEALLRQHPKLAAVALVLPPGSSPDMRPVAFLVPNGSEEPQAIALRKYLRGRCSERLIPEKIVYLQELPLNSKGAIDRTRLIEMEWGAEAAGDNTNNPSDAPQTEAAVILAAIWRELLNIPYIGINDKFFDLGGHSLLSIQMIARIESKTGYRFKLRDVLTDTLGQLAERMTDERKKGTGK